MRKYGGQWTPAGAVTNAATHATIAPTTILIFYLYCFYIYLSIYSKNVPLLRH